MLKLHRTLARSYQRVFSPFFLSDISLICKGRHTSFPWPKRPAKNANDNTTAKRWRRTKIASKLRTRKIVPYGGYICFCWNIKIDIYWAINVKSHNRSLINHFLMTGKSKKEKGQNTYRNLVTQPSYFFSK